MSNTIALFGSSRRHGNTGQLLDHLVASVGIEVVDLGQLNISPYDYEHQNRGDDFEPLMKRVLKFDRVIIASPVYWYAVSPPVKVFLDRISDFLDIPELMDDGRRLRGKIGYVVCTSIYADAPAPFIGALTETFSYLGVRYGGVLHANCRDGYSSSLYESKVSAFRDLLSSTRSAAITA